MIFNKAAVNSSNNRYNVTISVQTESGQDSNVVPAIFVEGQPGKTVYLYTNYDNGFQFQRYQWLIPPATLRCR